MNFFLLTCHISTFICRFSYVSYLQVFSVMTHPTIFLPTHQCFTLCSQYIFAIDQYTVLVLNISISPHSVSARCTHHPLITSTVQLVGTTCCSRLNKNWMNKYFLILPTFSVFHGIASVIVMYPPCTFVARPHPFKIFSFPFLPSPHVDSFQFNGIVTIPKDSMLLYRPVVLTRPFNTQAVDIVAHTILPVLPISKKRHLNLINTTLLVIKRALSASQISQRMWLSEYNFTSKIVRLGFNSHWVRKHEYQTSYLHALSMAPYLRKVGSHGGGMKIGSLVFMQNSI